MERLTYKLGNNYGLNDKASSKVGLFTDYDGFWAYYQAVNKLGHYEDLAEQGKMIELPCKVGDKAYSFFDDEIIELEVLKIQYEVEAENYSNFTREKIFVSHKKIEIPFDWSDFGKTVFLTHKEAEQAIAEMESENAEN